MLTDIRGHVSLTIGSLVQRTDRILRHDGCGLAVASAIPEPVSLPPTVDLLPPLCQRIRIGERALGTFHLQGNLLVEFAQYGVDRANDWNVHRHNFGDRGWIDVDVNNFRARAELRNGIGDAVIKARTHRQNHVRVMHRHIGLVKAVHTEHSEKLGITAGIGAQSHQGICHRIVQATSQRGQFFRALALNYSAARVDNRSFGTQEQAGRFAYLTRMAFCRRLIRTQTYRVGILVFKFVLRVSEVLRNIDYHRTGPTRRGNEECFLDSGGNILRSLNQETVFHDRP